MITIYKIILKAAQSAARQKTDTAIPQASATNFLYTPAMSERPISQNKGTTQETVISAQPRCTIQTPHRCIKARLTFGITI